MVRHLLQTAADQPSALADFTYEGFSYAPHLGEPAFPHFVREAWRNVGRTENDSLLTPFDYRMIYEVERRFFVSWLVQTYFRQFLSR